MPSRPFLPVDVSFMDDDKVVEAGPAAAWLFLGILLACKRNGTDGTITRAQLARLGITSWQKHVRTLQDVGLVMDVSEDPSKPLLWVPSWAKWNLLEHEREEKRQKARKAAHSRWGNDAQRNAKRIAPSNANADAREEKRREETQRPDLEPVENVLRRMQTW